VRIHCPMRRQNLRRSCGTGNSVEWSLGGAGYNTFKDALGGTPQLDAEADVGVKVCAWQEKV
jgi:hypothetical protein